MKFNWSYFMLVVLSWLAFPLLAVCTLGAYVEDDEPWLIVYSILTFATFIWALMVTSFLVAGEHLKEEEED